MHVPVGRGGDEISHLSERFNEMAARLAATEERERQFLMSVSHELRTPLTAIKGHVDALRDGLVDDPELVSASLDVVANEATRLERLVGDVLDLAKLRAHRFTVQTEEVDMGRLVEHAYGSFGDEARRREIDYALEGAERAPTIITDGDRVLQVITNLLKNAFRWTPDGGRIGVALEAANGTVRVDVTDTGPGIGREDAQRIFSPFVSHDTQGTGLGLPIARELAGALGGTDRARHRARSRQPLPARPAGALHVGAAAATRVVPWWSLPRDGPRAPTPAHARRRGLRCARPRQWTKNLLLFAGIVFAAQLGDPSRWVAAITAFVAYCAASSAAYLVNDVRDVASDRLHPVKRGRPIARGELAPRTALALAAALGVLALALGAALGPASLACVVAFAVLQAAYSLGLKSLELVDVITIAGLFVLRAAAGAIAVDVRISQWLLLCTFLLALFVALGKRRAELGLEGVQARGRRSRATRRRSSTSCSRSWRRRRSRRTPATR